MLQLNKKPTKSLLKIGKCDRIAFKQSFLCASVGGEGFVEQKTLNPMKFQSLFFLSSPRESCIQLSSMEHLTITDDSDDSTVCRHISVFSLSACIC